MSPFLRIALAMGLVGLVAACGTRPGIRDEVTAVSAAAQALAREFGGAQVTERRDTSVITAGTAAQVRQVMATLSGDLHSVIVEKTNESSILQDAGSNNGYRRWVTPTGQTYTLRSGILTGTRGMGYDLMSVEAAAVMDHVRHQREGRITRTYRFLDGVDHEVPVVAQCTIARAGHANVTLPTGATRSTQKMTESCALDGRTIVNTYWVASGGQVVRSRQWASDEIGVLVFQALRGRV